MPGITLGSFEAGEFWIINAPTVSIIADAAYEGLLGVRFDTPVLNNGLIRVVAPTLDLSLVGNITLRKKYHRKNPIPPSVSALIKFTLVSATGSSAVTVDLAPGGGSSPGSFDTDWVQVTILITDFTPVSGSGIDLTQVAFFSLESQPFLHLLDIDAIIGNVVIPIDPPSTRLIAPGADSQLFSVPTTDLLTVLRTDPPPDQVILRAPGRMGTQIVAPGMQTLEVVSLGSESTRVDAAPAEDPVSLEAKGSEAERLQSDGEESVLKDTPKEKDPIKAPGSETETPT